MVSISEPEPTFFNVETGQYSQESREPSGAGWVNYSSPEAQESIRTGMLVKSSEQRLSWQEAERRAGVTMQEVGMRELARRVGGTMKGGGVAIQTTQQVAFTPTRYKQTEFAGSESSTSYVSGIRRVGETQEHYLERFEAGFDKGVGVPVVVKEAPVIIRGKEGELKSQIIAGEQVRLPATKRLIEDIEPKPTGIRKREVKEGFEQITVNRGSPREAELRITTTRTGREEYVVTQTEITKKIYENGKLTSTEVLDKAPEGSFFNVPLMVSETRQAGATATMGSAGTTATLTYPIYSVSKEWFPKGTLTPKETERERAKALLVYESGGIPTKVLQQITTLGGRESKEYLLAVGGEISEKLGKGKATRDRREIVLEKISREIQTPSAEVFKTPSTYIEPFKSVPTQVALLTTGGAVLGVASKTVRGGAILQSRLVQAGLLAGIGYEGVQTARRTKEEIRAGDIGAGLVEVGLFGTYLVSGVAGFKAGARAVKSSTRVMGLKTRDTGETIKIINERAKLDASYDVEVLTQEKIFGKPIRTEQEIIQMDIMGAGKITKGGKKFDIDSIIRTGQEQLDFVRMKGTTEVLKHKIDPTKLYLRTQTIGERMIRIQQQTGTARVKTDVDVGTGRIKSYEELDVLWQKGIIKGERVEFGKPVKRKATTDIGYDATTIRTEIEPKIKPSEVREFTRMDFVQKRINDVLDKALSRGILESKRVKVGTGKKKTGGYEIILEGIKARTIEVKSGFKFEPRITKAKPEVTRPSPRKPIYDPKQIMKAKIKPTEKITTRVGDQRVQLAQKPQVQKPQTTQKVVDTAIKKTGIKQATQETVKLQAESIAKQQQRARASINTGNVGRIRGAVGMMSVNQLIQESIRLQQQDTQGRLRISAGQRVAREPRIRQSQRQKQEMIPPMTIAEMTAEVTKQTQTEKEQLLSKVTTRQITEPTLVRTPQTPEPIIPRLTRTTRIGFPFIPFGYARLGGEAKQLRTRLKTITHNILELF